MVKDPQTRAIFANRMTKLHNKTAEQINRLMTAEELRAELFRLELNFEQLSKLTGYSISYIHQLACGSAPMSGAFSDRVRLIAKQMCP